MRLKGRGTTSRYSTLQEVILVIDILLKTLEEAKDRITKATTNNYLD